MTQQTFPASTASSVVMTQVYGDLEARAWDEQTIKIETDGHVDGLSQEGNVLRIVGCHSDIELWVPVDATISATSVSGDATIEGVRRVELKDVSGDVELKDIGGDAELENIAEAAVITDVGGDLEVTNTPTLRVYGSIGGDAELRNVASVEIETVGADLALQGAETVVVSTVGSDLEAMDVGVALRCGVVGSDCQVQGSADTEVTVGNVGGDLEVNGAARVQLGNVGGDCALHNVQGDVEMGYVGADASFVGIGGNLRMGGVGADAELKDLQGNIEVGSVGRDLDLQASFPADSRARLNIGGDAEVVLPENPNLSIRATVGGDVSGQSIVSSFSGNMINLVYGDGSAQLELNVGGDLELRGKGSPRSSSSGSWGDFGRDMADLGREMGRLGEELSREIAASFREAGWSLGANVADEIARKAEERARRAQRRAEEQTQRAQRHAEEQARRAEERASRINVRFNEREWRLDPERLERIKEQARRAAAEGVSGALEAVERAVRNLGVPLSPVPPPSPGSVPPVPPTPPGPVPPMPPTPGSVPPVPPMPPFSSQPNRNFGAGMAQSEQATQQDSTTADTPVASAPDLEQEREAILSMIAEGRITPEEGDLLLEALGS